MPSAGDLPDLYARPSGDAALAAAYPTFTFDITHREPPMRMIHEEEES